MNNFKVVLKPCDARAMERHQMDFDVNIKYS